MGAALSIPFLVMPGMGTVLSFAASCCGAATCSMMCSALGQCQDSVMTQVGYAVLLLVNSLISWLMLTDWALKKLEHFALDYMTITCNGKECYGFVAIHRINFALGAFHAIMALMLYAVNSRKKSQDSIQNGFWGPKLFAWASFIVISFLIPDSFFVFWGNYVAHAGAMVFLVIGLILLIHLAYSWTEYCTDKESQTWQMILMIGSIGMYLASFAMTIVMYIFFAKGGCSMNQAWITINLIFLFLVSALSLAPAVQDARPTAGLGVSSLIALYCTYLTMSAVAMEPDDKHCNPLVRANGTRTASIVVGAVMTFIMVAYSTTRAANSFFPDTHTQAISLDEEQTVDHAMTGQTYVTTQPPDSNRDFRRAALAAAIQQGSLPAGTVDSDSDDEEDHSPSYKQTSSRYNYVLFHLMFMLAAAWVATLLTMNVNPQEHEGDFIAVGRTYWASWVKIVSSWVCYAIYAWTLYAPVLMPDRFMV